MVIHGIDDRQFPVLSGSRTSRSGLALNFNYAGSPNHGGRIGAGDRDQARSSRAHEDSQPRHHHLGIFCPAGSGCGLYKCQIHGCRCRILVTSSSVITFGVTLCTIFLMVGFGSRMMNFGESSVGVGDGLTVPQILKKFPVTNEIERQLRLLDHARVGSCVWKVSWECQSGLPNIAAIELGASIASTYDTVPYGTYFCGSQTSQSCEKSCAETILKHDVVPGRNFNFRGVGKVLIKLNGNAIISGFTLHHPHKDLLPNGFMDSAPKDFEVKGYDQEKEDMHLFGTYQYILGSSSAQAFPVKLFLDKQIDLIEVSFLTNHGNAKYTAVYRFEVHGDIML